MSQISRPAFLRIKALEALSLVPEGRRVTVEVLQQAVNDLIKRDVLCKQLPASEPELNLTLGRLLDKAQVAYLVNPSTELQEYHITMTGRQALQD